MKHVPVRYLPNKLTKKDKIRQARMLNKSRKMYKKGLYFTRSKVKSFKSKPSNHVKNALRIYNVDSIKNSVIIAQVSGSNHDGVIDARNMFSDMIPKRLKEIEKALKNWKAKKPKIVMKFAPQLYGENKSNKAISV